MSSFDNEYSSEIFADSSGLQRAEGIGFNIRPREEDRVRGAEEIAQQNSRRFSAINNIETRSIYPSDRPTKLHKKWKQSAIISVRDPDYNRSSGYNAMNRERVDIMEEFKSRPNIMPRPPARVQRQNKFDAAMQRLHHRDDGVSVFDQERRKPLVYEAASNRIIATRVPSKPIHSVDRTEVIHTGKHHASHPQMSHGRIPMHWLLTLGIAQNGGRPNNAPHFSVSSAKKRLLYRHRAEMEVPVWRHSDTESARLIHRILNHPHRVKRSKGPVFHLDPERAATNNSLRYARLRPFDAHSAAQDSDSFLDSVRESGFRTSHPAIRTNMSSCGYSREEDGAQYWHTGRGKENRLLMQSTQMRNHSEVASRSTTLRPPVPERSKTLNNRVKLKRCVKFGSDEGSAFMQRPTRSIMDYTTDDRSMTRFNLLPE
jgi:hypothetical protein